MPCNDHHPNRSPRSPPMAQRERTTESCAAREDLSMRKMSGGTRHSPTSSMKLGLRSRHGSMVGRRQSSQATSRQTNSSGGVLGLPGASQLEQNSFDLGLDGINGSEFDFDSWFNATAYDSNQPDATQTFSDNPDANLPQNSFDPHDIDFALLDGGNFGLDLHPVMGEQHHTLQQTNVVCDDQSGHGREPQLQALWNQQLDSFAPSNIENFSTDMQTIPGVPALYDPFPVATQPPDPFPRIHSYPDPQDPYPYTQPYFHDPYAKAMYYSGGNPNTQYHDEQYYQQTLQAVPLQQTGYTPAKHDSEVDLPVEQESGAFHTSTYEPTQEHDRVLRHPKPKRSRSIADAEDNVPIVKRRRVAPIAETPSEADRTRHNSAASDNLERPVKIVQPLRAGEKPKKADGKDQVRINTSTRGETTRTAGINQYNEEGSKYRYKELPLTEERPDRDWATRRFDFEYTHHERWGMDELKKSTMSTHEIYDYITQFPNDLLRIWIQRTPADSSRRYPTGPYDECRFEDCPNRVWANKGTIEVGHYRVAFDEKHKTYGKNHVDPFDCAGYAHLYCMERFLDFPFICQVADVRVDDRVDMPREPKGVGKFAFSHKQEAEKIIAERFVKAAKVNGLHRTPEFQEYPVHGDYKEGRPKAHARTLTYAMYEQNLKTRSPSQNEQFILREIEPGFMGVHMGDQEVKVYRKRIESRKEYKTWKRGSREKAFPYADYYDDETSTRIAECLQEQARLKSQKAAGAVSRASKKGLKGRKAANAKIPLGRYRKRVHAAIEESDDDSGYAIHGNDDDSDSDFGKVNVPQQHITRGAPVRQSPRKKQRIDYSELPDGRLSSHIAKNLDEPEHITQQRPHELYAAYPRDAAIDPQLHVPGIPGSQPNSEVPTLRKPSGGASHLFPQAQPFDIDQLPLVTENPQDERKLSWNAMAAVDDLISIYADKPLNRRKSSTMSIGPFTSIMKSPQLPGSPRVNRSNIRTASFNAQPVSSSKEYNIDDPPTQVTTSPNLTRTVYDRQLQSRRSARLASKTTDPSSPPDKLRSGRANRSGT